MADNEHIIEILLRARDETAAAFASAMGQQEAYQRLQDAQIVKNKELGDSYDRISQKLETNQTHLNKSQAEYERFGNAAVDAQVRLENAAKAHARVQADAEKSDAAREQTARRLAAATRDYISTLTDAERMEEAYSKSGARIRAERIKGLAVEAQAVEEHARKLKQARDQQLRDEEAASRRRQAQARAESDLLTTIENERVRHAKDVTRQIDATERQEHQARLQRLRDEATAERALHSERQARARENASAGREEQQRLRAQSRDQEDAFKRLRASIKGISSEKITPTDFDRFKKEISDTRAELARLGVDGRTIMAETSRAIKDNETSIGSLRRTTVQANEVDRIRAQILKDNEATQKRLITQTKEYAREIDNLARLQRQRGQAEARGAQAPGLNELDSQINIAKGRLRELALEIKAVSQERVVVGVDADTGAALTDLLNFDEVKAVVGRDIHLNVDVDTGAATAKLIALEQITKSGLGPNDESVSKWQQYKSAVEDSGNRVATFDNLLRGLVSLGIGVFLNQLVVLAGAAAGALTALASSAIYAGGALGGALVAGLAQALPVLGIFAVAISRITAVWKAAQQQQLLQQQTFAKSAKTAKQTADATDAITNAQDSLTAAHKRVAQAQQGVIDARQKAIRQLQDLILQERQAELAAKGAALSQQDAQEALRRAMSTGDTGSIARARLDVQSASLGVDQAALNRSRTQQDLATRRRAGIQGSPEVTQAKDQLESAKQAADQAQRSLEKAGRQASVTGDQSIAAAGKLNFMLSQLSDSERKLYEQFSTFIDRFRIQGGKIAEPIIKSVTGMMSRVNSMLNNPAMIGGAISLASKMSTQLDRIFNHFFGPRGAGIFLDFAKQAETNLKPLTDILINIGDIFANVAKAAGPALHALLTDIATITRNWADWTGSFKGQSALGDFFKEGMRQLRAFMRLGGALVQLILDIANPKIGGGAKTGGDLLNDMTGSVTRLDKAVRSASGSKWMQEFFENSRKAINALGPMLTAFAKQFANLFTPEGIKNIQSAAKLFSEVLIPAFGNFMQIMGTVMRVVGMFLDVPLVPQLARWAVSIGATFAILAKLQSVFTPLTAALKIMFPVLDGLGTRALEAFGKIVRGAVTATIQQARLGASMVIARARMIAMAAASKAVAAAQWLWNAALTANPIVLVVAGVIALIAILVLLERRFHIFEKAWSAIKSGVAAVVDFIKAHWKLLPAIFLGPLGIIVSLVLTHWDKIKHAFKSGIDSVVGFMKDLPGRVAHFAVDAANAIADAFSGIGGEILKGIVSGVKGAADFAKSIVNGIIGLVEKAINSVDKIGPIHVPDVHLPRLASGAYVNGNYAEGDQYHAVLAGDEMVLNPRQQQMAGRDRLMGILRATGAQVIGRGSGRFATGATPATALDHRAGATLTINADADMNGMASAWRKTWQEIVASTRRNAGQIEDRIRTMRVNTTATLTRFRRDSTELFVETEMSGKVHFGRLANSVEGAMTDVAKSVHTGFRYIASATNTVLKGFDADPVKFTIDAPPSASGGGQRAATGFLGQQGERGRDSMPIWVGRGEAVLNWAHQKMIEPALRAFYGFGLPELFGKTNAYHAGGASDIMPGLGFAKGGLTGPFGTGRAFNAVANFAKKKFGLSMTAGRTNHSLMTASGNVSDHSTGNAGDFSNGVLTPQEDGFSGFWKSKLPQTVKQLIYRNKDQFRGWPIPGHLDHVHLALKDQFAFADPRKMARLISRAMRGLKISDLLGNVTGDGAGVDHIDPLKVRGKGFLATVLRKALGKMRSAANNFLDEKALADPSGLGGPIDYSEHAKGALSRSQAQRVIERAMSMLGVDNKYRGLFDSTWLRQAFNESRFNPNAQNRTAAGVAAGGPMGFLQVVRDTFARYRYPGHNNPYNALDSTLAAMRYVAASYGGGNLVRGTQALQQRGGGAYARGGFVGGMMPAIRRAATGYWGGPDEQARIRRIRTTGNYSAPSVGIAEGDLTGAVTEFNRAAAQINKRIGETKRLGGKLGIITRNLTAITKENGLLDQINVGIQKFSDRLALRLKESVYKIGKDGIVSRGITADAEQSRSIAYARAVLKRYQDNLKRINKLVADNAKELSTVNDRIDEIQSIDPKHRTKKQKSELSDLTTSREDLITSSRDLRKRAEEARQSIADQLEALYQAQLDQFTKKTDAAMAGVETMGMNSAGLDRAMRKAQALGDGSQMDTIASAQIDTMVKQQGVLRDALKEAQSRGYGDLAQQYSDQISELDATIQEAVATRLSNAIDAVDNAATRDLAGNDRQQAAAALMARMPGANAAISSAQANANALSARGGILENQRSQYQALLLRAQSEGNIGQVQSLTDKLADLDATISENTVAVGEATVATRQARIDQITARGQFQGGVMGNLLGLVQAADPNATADAQRPYLEQQGQITRDTLTGLQGQLKDAFGIDVTGQTGGTLADSLRKLNYDGIEANFTDTQRQQFESLINSIIENATSVEQNTTAVQNLTGTMQPQGFTTSAWGWFRDAIFNGMGDVLPQYTVPSFDTGGSVVRGGLARLHTGEYVNPALKGGSTSSHAGDINIEINEAGGVPDPNYLAARMAFERRAARSSN